MQYSLDVNLIAVIINVAKKRENSYSESKDVF